MFNFPFSSQVDSTGGSTSRIRSDEVESSNEVLLHHITSFSPFQVRTTNQTIREVCALVTILRATGQLERTACSPNAKRFQAVLYLVKEDIYHVTVVPSGHGSTTKYTQSVKIKLDELEFAEVYPNEKFSLFVSFGKRGDVVLQFRHPELFMYFHKALTAVLRYFHPISEGKKKKKGGSVSRRQQGMYHSARKPEPKKESKLFGFLKSTLYGIIGSPEVPFETTNAGSWRVQEFRQFLEHEYIQHPRKEAAKTLHGYLNQYDIRGWNFLQTYFQNGNTVYDLRGEIERFEKLKKCRRELKSVFSDTEFRNRLRLGLDRIDEKGLYNITYSKVLKKRLSSLGKSGSLVMVERDLGIYRRFWWDPIELRDRILCLLLYKKSLPELVREIEKEFADQVKQKALLLQMAEEPVAEEVEGEEEESDEKNKEEEGEEDEEEESKGEVDLSSLSMIEREAYLMAKEQKTANKNKSRNQKEKRKKDERKLVVPPEVFRDVLEEFQKVFGIQLDGISFYVHIRSKQNKMILERDRLTAELRETKEKKKKVTTDFTKLELDLEQLNSKKKAFEDRLNTIREKKPEMVPRMEEYIAKIRGQIDEKLIEQTKIKDGLTDVDRKYSELMESSSNDIDKQITDCVPELQMHRREAFMGSKLRRTSIQNFLKRELDRVSKNGMIEFVCKLVLAVNRNPEGRTAPTQTSKWEARAMKLIDPLLKPSFYRWGTLHSSTLLSNLGIHWFSNGLVFVNQFSMGEKYEEVVAIDAFCPLIIDFQNSLDRIQVLSEEIVKYNAFYTYAPYSFFGGKNSKKKNCQEFAEALIRKLGGTPYFPIVRKYFDDVKKIVVASPGTTKGDELRFMTISEVFQQKFRTVLSQRKFRPKEGRLYFTSHALLDEFVMELHKVDTQFNLHFPGEAQLLKGFDRAFWIRISREPDNDNVKPSEHKCPMY